jgi:hypothetical protein
MYHYFFPNYKERNQLFGDPGCIYLWEKEMRRRPRHMVPILLVQHENITSRILFNYTAVQFEINS